MMYRPAMIATLAALCAPAVPGTAAPPADPSAEYAAHVRPFLTRHCFGCHGPKDAKAGMRLDTLGTDFLAGKTADEWKEVIDRINLGDMPPEGKPRPDPADAFAVVEWVGKELKRAEREAKMAGGRALVRRMNRSEYANTLRDLLRLDPQFTKQIADELPGDGKAEGFDRIGAALLFDDTQLSAYIALGGKAAEKAVVADETPPAAKTARMDFGKEWRADDKPHEVIQYQKDTAIPPGPGVSHRRGAGVEFVQTVGFDRQGEFGLVGHQYLRLLRPDSVPRDGYYRLRIKAGADTGKRGEPLRLRWVYAAKTPIQTHGELTVNGTPDHPEVVETVIYLRRMPDGAMPVLRLYWNGFDKVVIQHPELSKLTGARLRATSAVQKLVGASASAAEVEAAKKEVERRIEEARAWSKKPGAVAKIYNPDVNLDDVPRLYLEWAEFEGPVEPVWPPASHTALLPDGMPTDSAGVRRAFERFLPRAYRRPVAPAEVNRITNAVRDGREQFGLSWPDAVRFGLQTVLASPDFLLLFEPSADNAPPRPLTGHELASRLSYFLWSSMPDEELFRLAAAGTLTDPAVLTAQVRRMVADPKARAFAENFAGQWLHVREYGSVQPAKDYKSYDASLREASLEEPLAFFEEVLRGNLPITNFLDSDFLVINDRLARHYEIDGVPGPEFRSVPAPADRRRGGVLTMAGLLTYLSDGTRTLPVRRGAWVLEEIFNNPPPPPPPNAGEIQPNAAGKNLTVRERLEKHRNEATCASCHVKIDPLGLALENYDAVGAWRDRQNGEGFKGPNAPKIDASGTLPDGTSFRTPAEYKRALLADPDRFARAFTEKLLTYAIGRPVGFTDRATVDAIVTRLKADGYRIQTLIESIAQSEPFLTK